VKSFFMLICSRFEFRRQQNVGFDLSVKSKPKWISLYYALRLKVLAGLMWCDLFHVEHSIASRIQLALRAASRAIIRTLMSAGFTPLMRLA